LADFELSFFDLLSQFDTVDNDRCGSEALQSEHRAQSLLYPPVVLFDGVVKVLAGPYPHSLPRLAIFLQFGNCAV
jgi:hypothetical protein